MACKLLKKILFGSSRKIVLFLLIVLFLTIISGTLVYFVEGAASGFSSVLSSIFWASTTLLTMGYGDMVPQTGIGRVVFTFLRLLGYSILVVPIVIVLAEVYNSICNSFSGKTEGFE